MTKDNILRLDLYDLGLKVEAALGKHVKEPNTDIAGAWFIVEHLRAEGLTVVIRTVSPDSKAVKSGEANSGDWVVKIVSESPVDNDVYWAHAPELPEAVCRAFLIFHYGL
ncbi:hypothetical protein ACHHV8_09935 [Paenibacillus sp. TAB 01]|uniref:hypothetical protein n=1 Tax=Paenibacillus sp. TAB 01 TaxID=3368988 RepID=UPI00374FF68E